MSATRCFVGIELPECVREPIRSAADRLKQADRHWAAQRWMPEEQWHITLAFLGDLDDSAQPRLQDDLAAVAVAHTSFKLACTGVAGAPRGRSRMVWARFSDPDGSCLALSEAVSRAAMGVGVAPPERPFRPHATLARTHSPRHVDPSALERANEDLQAAPAMMSVVSFTLFASRLTPRGPIYSELASWSLHEE